MHGLLEYGEMSKKKNSQYQTKTDRSLIATEGKQASDVRDVCRQPPALLSPPTTTTTKIGKWRGRAKQLTRPGVSRRSEHRRKHPFTTKGRRTQRIQTHKPTHTHTQTHQVRMDLRMRRHMHARDASSEKLDTHIHTQIYVTHFYALLWRPAQHRCSSPVIIT